MYCIKCGANNSEQAVFCRKCGAAMEPEEETRVARRGPEELREAVEGRPILTVSPTLKFVILGYALAVIGAFLVAALVSAFFGVSAWVFLGMALLLVPALYHLRQKLVRYTLTDSTVEIDTGLISRTTQNIPLRRIQDVTVCTTIPQRLLGFGDVVIDNAGEDGGKVVLKNIDSPRKYADALLAQMRRLEM